MGCDNLFITHHHFSFKLQLPPDLVVAGMIEVSIEHPADILLRYLGINNKNHC